MFHRNSKKCSMACLLVLLGCQQGSGPGPERDEPVAALELYDTFVVGALTHEVGDKIRQRSPLAKYLAARLSDFGFGRGEVKITTSLETMADWLLKGEIDLFYDSYYPATVVAEGADIEPSLLRHKFPDEKYSVFFAHRDSGMTSLADLEGELLALEEPDSTTGFMLPVAHLIQSGFRPVEKKSPQTPVAAGETGYIFTLDDMNSIQWVISRRVAAAVVDNPHFDALPENIASQLVVLDKSEPILRHHQVLLPPGMDPRLAAAVRMELLSLGETEAGRSLLEHIGTHSFAEITPADKVRLKHARRFYELVKSPW